MSSIGIERRQKCRRYQVWPDFSMLPRFESGHRKGGVLTPPLRILLIVLPSRAPRSLWEQAARGARGTEV
jgi:hypothetical protein